MYCPNCGSKITTYIKICETCGIEFSPTVLARLRQEANPVSLARGGDPDAFAQLYESNYAKVLFAIRSVIYDEDVVMDILQDAFVQAFLHLNQLEDDAKFTPWIKTIAINRAKNYLKKKKPTLFTDMSVEEESGEDFEDSLENDCAAAMPEEVADQAETGRLIREIMECLPEEQRIAVNLYYYDEFSIPEIAEFLGVKEATVKSRLFYGRKKIKVKVEELEKQGTKLYGLAPLPFLLWLWKSMDAKAAEVTPDGRILASVLDSVNIADIADTSKDGKSSGSLSSESNTGHDPSTGGTTASGDTSRTGRPFKSSNFGIFNTMATGTAAETISSAASSVITIVSGMGTKGIAVIAAIAVGVAGIGSGISRMNSNTGEIENQTFETEDSSEVQMLDTIVFNDYVSVLFSGTEGSGSIKYDTDSDAFYEDVDSMGWDRVAVSEYLAEEESLSGDDLETATNQFISYKGARALLSDLEDVMSIHEPNRIYNGSTVVLQFIYDESIDYLDDYEYWSEAKAEADELIGLLNGDFGYYEEEFIVSGLEELTSYIYYSDSDDAEDSDMMPLELGNLQYSLIEDEESEEMLFYFSGELSNPNENYSVANPWIYVHVILNDQSSYVFTNFDRHASDDLGIIAAGETMLVSGLLDVGGENANFDVDDISRIIVYTRCSSSYYYDSDIYVLGEDDFEIEYTIADDGTISGDISLVCAATENSDQSTFSSVSWANHILTISVMTALWKDDEFVGYAEDTITFTVGVDDSDWGTKNFVISSASNWDYDDCIVMAMAISEKYSYETDGASHGGTYFEEDEIYG